MNLQYEVVHKAPTAEEYVHLRLAAGLSPKSLQAAENGLGNSVFALTLRVSSKLIGMGRIIGDGGCFYQIVDIAVEPAYQGNGLGKVIMSELTAYLSDHAPEGSYVSLLADVPADKLYKQFGFEYTQPKSVGMYKRY